MKNRLKTLFNRTRTRLELAVVQNDCRGRGVRRFYITWNLPERSRGKSNVHERTISAIYRRAALLDTSSRKVVLSYLF